MDHAIFGSEYNLYIAQIFSCLLGTANSYIYYLLSIDF